MTISSPVKPIEVVTDIITTNGSFPGNARLPLLIYKNVFQVNQLDAAAIKNLLKSNQWGNAWVDGIYDYHHYHSNCHEVLVIIAGECDVMYGGPNGKIHRVQEGDVIIHPAGVSHKRIKASENFACVGAYPASASYDMNYGKAEEHPEVDLNISNVGLPPCDPIFGKNGLLFQYWQ